MIFMFPTILIVDDEPSILQSLSGLLADEGFEVITASNGYEALKIIETEAPDLVLLDIWMPGMDGIETLKEIKRDNSFIQVVIITGHGTIETAVKATKMGAFDFIEKPLSIDKVIVAINNALNFRRLEEENKYLRRKTIEKNSINGNSSATLKLTSQIAIAAPSDSWILITGENGTGKELAARTIHQLSARAEQPLVDVNCAAIPEELIESELFGHEKGSFPGAVAKKIGKFEMAGQGTLYLDEIGDMSDKTQAKILRVLEEKKFQRCGGSRVLSVGSRVIASTNMDLPKEIERGNFREDLYYRLNVIPVRVPPLRERIGDIPILVETFFKEISGTNGLKPKHMTQAAIDLLLGYAWPGNVRELKNLVERLAIMVDTETIDAPDLPPPYGAVRSGEVPAPEAMPLFAMHNLQTAKSAFENAFMQKKLSDFNNDIDQTAEAIGVEPAYLQSRLQATKNSSP